MSIDIKTLLQSKKATRVLYIIGGIIIALIIFQAGMFVGLKKASFAFGLGDNYYRTFGGHRNGMGMFNDFRGRDLPNAHGTIGKIIRVSLPTLIIEGKDNIEKVIVIKNDTDIRSFRNIASTTDLMINTNVMVLGTPTETGEISARLIRIMPSDTDTANQSIRK